MKPTFKLPTASSELLDRIRFLRVEYEDGLLEHQAASLASLLKCEGGDRHVSMRQNVSLGSRTMELSAILGLHDLRSTEEYRARPADQADESGFWIHFHAGIQKSSGREASEDADWGEVMAALGEVLGPQPLRADLRMTVPADSATLAVSLPIALEGTGVPGFTSIRGVELVLESDGGDSEPIYSVILQRLQSSVTASTWLTAELTIDEGVLLNAWERSIPVVKLAIPSLEV